MRVAFRLSDNADPEERLEEAALWKAMSDEYGADIEVIKLSDEERGVDPAVPTFGRGLGRTHPGRRNGALGINPVSDELAYWHDPAVVANARRKMLVLPFDEAEKAVAEIHRSGSDAFVKSTFSMRFKPPKFHVPIGTTLADAMGDLVYSYIDGGPPLLVQEFKTMRYETRYFCIDREIVTWSPNSPELTPLDYPLPAGTLVAQFGGKRTSEPVILPALLAFAWKMARSIKAPHAVIDCAMIDGKPGIVELNPMVLGQIGLFACDVRALAKASRKLLPGFGINDTKETENAGIPSRR